MKKERIKESADNIIKQNKKPIKRRFGGGQQHFRTNKV